MVNNKPRPTAAENPWIEGVKTVAASLILALGIRQFVAEARYIPSESMLPTLEVNDRLIIEKVTYHFSTPQRGDIVVFWSVEPSRTGVSFFRDALIKRAIGLPGDKIEVRDGQVYVNDQPLNEPYLAAAPDYQWGPMMVPPNSYLMLGDNRNNSYDGHLWGFLPEENIIGRAAFRFWPPDRLGGLGTPPPYTTNVGTNVGDMGDAMPSAAAQDQ